MTRLVVAVFVLSIFLFGGTPVHADDWVWRSPTVTAAEVIPGYDEPTQVCKGMSELVTIHGEPDPMAVCWYQQAKSVAVGTYGSNKAVIRFGQERTGYALFNCKPPGCLYDPSLDLVIIEQHIVGLFPSLVIYKHATQRLVKMATTISGYGFDFSDPDYVDWNSAHQPVQVGSLALSNNGQWLAMEYPGSGFGVMHLTDFSMQKVAANGFSYGDGMNPVIDLAITNDGTTVAVGGWNATSFLIHSPLGCGYDPLYDQPSEITCDITPMEVAEFSDIGDGYQYVTSPQFNEDGSQLRVAAAFWPSTVRVVTIRSSQFMQQSLSYLGIGDSYTSGEGEDDDGHYLPGTNEPFEKCHTSDRSYPYLVATLARVADVHSVACSGATIADVVSNLLGYDGQSERLGDRGLRLSPQLITARQLAALDTFLPGEVPQGLFIDRYQPRVIFVGIGGNDAGFMDKMLACMMPDECEWTSATGKAQTGQEIAALQPKLTALYQNLHERSPTSQIIAVGYPQIVKDGGDCDELTSLLFNPTERQFLHESIDYIDRVIAAAAQQADVHYVDIQGVFGDHALCGASQQRAVNEIRTGDDVAPISLFSDVKAFGNESFHPTPLGHQLIAQALFAHLADLDLPPGTCAIIVCLPQHVAEPQDWPVDGAVQTFATVMTSSILPVHTRELSIAVRPGSFAAHSPVTIEVHSTPTHVGDVVAESDGSVQATITLPSELSTGYHTLHVSGMSYTGQAVDYYQTVTVSDTPIRLQAVVPVGASPPTMVTQQSTLSSLRDSDDTSSPSAAVKGAAVRMTKPVAARHSVDESWKLVVAGALFAAAFLAGVLILRTARNAEV